MPRFLITFLLLLTSLGGLRAQTTTNTDSLWAVYRNTTLIDTVRMRALQQLNTVIMANNPDSGLIICDTLYEFAKSRGNEKFMGQATHSRGIIFKVKGQYSQSVRAYFETLQHWSAADFDEGLANCHQNLANVYGRLHQTDKARMLGYEILQDVVLLEEIKTTSQALKRLDEKVTVTLNKNDKSHRDGMDMALCAFSKEKKSLQFSGANRPLIHVTGSKVNHYKPDKHTIGGAIDEAEKNFAHHDIAINEGDMIYVFTDGYADQFGGPGGKKFMSKQLEELLIRNSSLSCAEQKHELHTAFDQWRGSLEQVDDICIIGIRI